MAELAALGLSVTSEPVVKATAALTDLTGAAVKTERAVEDLAVSDKALSAGMQALIAEVQRVNTGLAGLSAISAQTASATSATSMAINKLGEAMRKPREETENLAASVDSLRAKYSPLIAASQQYQAALKQIAAAEAAGGISAREAAQHRQAAAAAAERQANAMPRSGTQSGGSSGRARLDYQGLSYQANDVLTMGLMGASPFQILASQGGQVFQTLQQSEGGVRGGLKAIAADVGSAAAATASFLGPQGIIATGLLATGAAVAYFATRVTGIKPLEDVLKRQADAVRDLRDAYKLTGDAAEDYKRRATGAIEEEARRSSDESRKRLQQGVEDIRESFFSASSDRQNKVSPEFESVRAAVLALMQSAKSGSPDFITLRNTLSEISRIDPEKGGIWDAFTRGDLARAILDATKELVPLQAGLDAAARAARELELGKIKASRERYEDAREGLNSFVPKTLTDRDRVNRAFQEEMGRIAQLRGVKGDEQEDLRTDALRRQKMALEDIDKREQTIRDGRALDIAGLGRLSAEEQRRLAILRERNALEGDTSLSAADKDRRAQAAGEVAYARAVQQSNDAARQRAQGMRDEADGLVLQLSLIGKTAEQTARATAEFNLLRAARDAAYQENRDISQAELDAIQKQVDLVGQLARVEAERRLATDATDRRKSLFMSDQDATISASLKNAGVDPNSAFAQQYAAYEKLTDRLLAFRDLNREVWSGIGSEIIKGGDPLKKIGENLQNAAGKLIDTSIQNVADGLFQNLLGSLNLGLDGPKLPTRETVGLSRDTAMWVRSADGFGGLGASSDVERRPLAPLNDNGKGDRVIDSATARVSSAFDVTGLPKDRRQVAEYIAQAAALRGIDPATAQRVFKQESSFNPFATNISSREESYGVTQLNAMGGLGAVALKQGINIRDPNTWRQQVDFSLDTVQKDGWRQWYGARDVGIGRWDGINRNGGEITKDPFQASSNALAADASTFQAGFASTLNDGLLSGMGQAVDSFAPGFGGVLQNLLRAVQGGGSGGGGGLLRSLFGGGGINLGSGISAGAQASILGGASGLFADGGYTGFGGIHEPAGVVHRGEVVWSQRDVARAGGVAVVEGMRRGMRGYAEGGYVGGGGPGLSVGGAKVNLVVNNFGNANVEATQKQDSNGETSIELAIDRVQASNINKRSSRTSRALRGMGVDQPVMKR
ncbi:hypothetical protein GCM10011390_41620 [Aureimonas endophytica]|uniref:Bacteriophage tail tape measure N-terminal domain-containing protein n=1 Tax=Aureimonas endophytica TaxID=2027858 RepID=A0A916ZXN6_9HYPH|nr:phage tail length tape measure family protein [Aureimonas endophytica]GGE18113.1 hypothetical protein GCM10011390_41620 [Aureimonas endophytica]